MRNKFTEVEVEELVASVKANPQNLQKVFRELSAKWGTHSAKCIARYYYQKVKNTNQCFLTVSEKKAFLNRKIVPENMEVEPVRIKKSLWDKIKNFFKL